MQNVQIKAPFVVIMPVGKTAQVKLKVEIHVLSPYTQEILTW